MAAQVFNEKRNSYEIIARDFDELLASPRELVIIPKNSKNDWEWRKEKQNTNIMIYYNSDISYWIGHITVEE